MAGEKKKELTSSNSRETTSSNLPVLLPKLFSQILDSPELRTLWGNCKGDQTLYAKLKKQLVTNNTSFFEGKFKS